MSNKQDFAKTATLGVAAQKTTFLELSDVLFVATAKLKPNPHNLLFFREESAEYFDRLRKDVSERGIIVPLIARSDDTLLAGHNRLRVAQELGFEKVPVQYVDKHLTADEEKEFLVKDNLYRRQLSTSEWIDLYRNLFPNFDERTQQKAVGRKSKTEIPHDGGISTVPDSAILTAREIAQATGQKERTVQHQLQKHREAVSPKTVPDKSPKTAEERLQKLINSINFQFIETYDLLNKWDTFAHPAPASEVETVLTTLEHQIFALKRRMEIMQRRSMQP